MMNVNILSPQMKVNVESILSPELSEGYASENGVSSNIKITERPKSTCYHIDVAFHNSLKSDLTLGDNVTAQSGDKNYFVYDSFKVNSFRI